MPPEDYKFWPDLNHGQGWLCGVSGVLSVILFIAAWKKRESRAGKKLRYGALSCAALSLAVLACGGGQLVRALYWLDLVELGAVAAPIFLSGFFAFEIWDLNHPVTVRDESKAARKWQRITLKVLTAVLLILSLAMGIFSFLRVATVNLTAQEAVIGVETLENGDIQIVYSDLVCSTGGIRSDDFDGLYTRGWAGEVYAHRLGFKDSMDRKVGGACPHYTSAQLDVSPSIWYMGPDGTAETLLWDGGTEAPEGALVERDYALGIHCLGTALACVLLAFIGKKFPWAGKYLRCAALAAGSLSLAGVCISGGQFYVLGSGRAELHYTVRNSFFTAIPMFLTGLCAMKLRDLRRQM